MKPKTFLDALIQANCHPFMGVPCSVFKSLINFIEENRQIENYLCSSEGEAMGMAAGFSLCEKTPVVYMQNDGYGNAVNPLSSLQLLYGLPALLLISWRAEPGRKDAPQHKIMGQTINRLLEVFSIPYSILDDNMESLQTSLSKAKSHFASQSTPFAFIIKRGYFEKFEKTALKGLSHLRTRIEYLDILARYVKGDEILLGTTGFSGRELYQKMSHKGKFYMVGSMGCLPSIGLAIAMEHPKRNIIIIDGDGALIMKMGSLSTIGYYQPINFIHICFDNQAYESTGGQSTTSACTDFAAVALANGYKTAKKIDAPEDFEEAIKAMDQFEKPCFMHVKIRPGTIEGLERPSDSPVTMKKNLMEFLGSCGHIKTQ